MATNAHGVEGYSNLRTVVAAFLAVAVATFCVYLPTLQNELLEWDDAGYIIENQVIRELNSETVRWAFSTFYTNYWAPLTWLSFALDYAIWGMNPVGYHLTNNLLHAMNAGMVFLLFFQLLKPSSPVQSFTTAVSSLLNAPNARIGTALFAALIFALHPLRVESVAWASDRKDVLALFFGLPSLLAYLKHALAMQGEPSRPRPPVTLSPYFWLAVVCYCLSLLSKPLLVTVPIALLVLDWYPLKRFNNSRPASLFLEKVPLLVCAGIVSAITAIANRPLFVSLEDFNMTSRFLNAAKSIVAYFRLMVWPADLSPFYLGPGNITEVGLEYGLPLFIIVVITLSCALFVKRLPVLAAAWVIYLITLFPLLGFSQAGPQAMASRYTYLAGLPMSFLAALGIVAAYARFSSSRPARIFIISCALLAISAGCFFTWQQIAVWKNDVTLWTRVIDLNPHSIGRAYYQRGYAHLAAGELQKALDDMNEAQIIADRKKYRQIQDIYLMRARILTRIGDYSAAIDDYSRALAVDKTANRLIYYLERGNLYREQGMRELAEQDYLSAGRGVNSGR